MEPEYGYFVGSMSVPGEPDPFLGLKRASCATDVQMGRTPRRGR
jgi:hypothetical protein